ncbi:hypothetical protein CBW46_019280 [Paenibacillus xerothermodurans]|uniref:Uncharacterized protein n=1 Tax=Paenibacillus xerothermodurans TaxID=1977292 RepID=A0A2W1N6Z6_PAEXE|nr:hypothetical protein CBW46_019280 [Paenibacillus xerothermodurans]
MNDYLLIVAVASFLYPMRNLLGMLTRFAIYGMIAMALFSGTIKGWEDRLFFVAVFSIPVVINWTFKLFKWKLSSKFGG